MKVWEAAHLYGQSLLSVVLSCLQHFPILPSTLFDRMTTLSAMHQWRGTTVPHKIVSIPLLQRKNRSTNRTCQLSNSEIFRIPRDGDRFKYGEVVVSKSYLTS